MMSTWCLDALTRAQAVALGAYETVGGWQVLSLPTMGTIFVEIE